MTTNIYDMADTWNSAGTVFHAIKMNVANTAAAAGSKLIELLNNNVSQFAVDPSQGITVGSPAGGLPGPGKINAIGYLVNGVPLSTGIPEAPTDGQVYSRRGSDATWQVSPSGGGGGNVISVGTPTNGQWAQWTDSTHIQGVNSSAGPWVLKAGDSMTGTLQMNGLVVAGINFFPSTAATKTGRLYQVGDTLSLAVLSGPDVLAVNLLTNAVTFAGAVNLAADPTTALQAATKQYVDTRAPLASPVFTGDPQAPTPATADNDTSIATTAFVKAQGYVTGGPYQALDATLTALAAYATVGLLTMTAADTFAGRALAAPAAGLTITNPAGTAGNPTFALANDLAALEALSGTNTIYYRSGADAWSPVTIGANLTFTGGTLAATGGGGGDVFLANANVFTNYNYFNGNAVVLGHTVDLSMGRLQINGVNAALARESILLWEAGASSPVLSLRHSRGATGANAATIANDGLGSIEFVGNSGTAFVYGATINAVQSAAIAGGNAPAMLQIATTNASGATAERIRIWPSGGLMLDPAIGANDPGLGGLRCRRYAAHQLTDSPGVDGYGMANSTGTQSGYVYQEGSGAMAMATGYPALNFRFGASFPLCGQFNDSGFSAGMNNNVVSGGNQFCGIRWGNNGLQPLGLFFGGDPPTFNAMNGSLYINANGSIGSHLYVAANGGYSVGNNWVAVPGV
jgi:hypothetical protein